MTFNERGKRNLFHFYFHKRGDSSLFFLHTFSCYYFIIYMFICVCVHSKQPWGRAQSCCLPPAWHFHSMGRLQHQSTDTHTHALAQTHKDAMKPICIYVKHMKYNMYPKVGILTHSLKYQHRHTRTHRQVRSRENLTHRHLAVLTYTAGWLNMERQLLPESVTFPDPSSSTWATSCWADLSLSLSHSSWICPVQCELHVLVKIIRLGRLFPYLHPQKT